ncbi:hypothetical protein [Actinoplanes teichomyceticus]|uniref:Uncharacterized protein n=1 Tax=Actinoplanes teichomyceticus TaxID=1867 RepID=A0A561VGF7_ACTTI|nr:hypothetical protein [Actinoplanes teichomyceticus]TWG10687.1 hypothetical protein FHX34_107181 [Actinoplanes teichomyceticus]GIF15456.1 hypothetical protein Ate01nite_54880 [Actinoplanes teichomyceticus]
MTRDPDAWAIWGDWDLREFRVQIARWRDTTHPPDDVVHRVDRWWPRLRQRLEWWAAARVSRQNDPEGNQRWMWVPGADWLDDDTGYFRVQCFFRVHEAENPPWLECSKFRTVQALTPAEVRRADGMDRPEPAP